MLERFAPKLSGREPDEAKIADAMPRVKRAMEVLGEWLDGNDYLAGASVSIADFFMVPIVLYFYMTPEGKPLCEASRPIMAWWDKMASRPSFAETSPDVPE